MELMREILKSEEFLNTLLIAAFILLLVSLAAVYIQYVLSERKKRQERKAYPIWQDELKQCIEKYKALDHSEKATAAAFQIIDRIAELRLKIVEADKAECNYVQMKQVK